MFRPFKDPLMTAALAIVPAAAIGFSGVIEYKAFVTPGLALFLWVLMVVQAVFVRRESADTPTVGPEPSEQPNGQREKLADQKTILLKTFSTSLGLAVSSLVVVVILIPPYHHQNEQFVLPQNG